MSSSAPGGLGLPKTDDHETLDAAVSAYVAGDVEPLVNLPWDVVKRCFHVPDGQVDNRPGQLFDLIAERLEASGAVRIDHDYEPEIGDRVFAVYERSVGRVTRVTPHFVRVEIQAPARFGEGVHREERRVARRTLHGHGVFMRRDGAA